jgi:hypothetical protein
MHISHTNHTIEAFIAASEAFGSDARQRHILRETLRSLVRQAKAEQLAEVRRSAVRASGFTVKEYCRLLPKVRPVWPGQGELKFGEGGQC